MARTSQIERLAAQWGEALEAAQRLYTQLHPQVEPLPKAELLVRARRALEAQKTPQELLAELFPVAAS